MKKEISILFLVLFAISISAFGQTNVDLGQDYNGSSVIAPSSGVLLATGTTSYTVPGDSEIKVLGTNVDSKYDDGSYGAKGTKYNYLQINSGGYIEIALTNTSKAKMLKSIKLNGTSGSTSVNIASLPVLFSDQYPFNEKSIIGYDTNGVLPFARAGNSGFTINNVPDGCKSIRIYRNVKLKNVNPDLFEIDLIDGTITIGQTAQTPRIAYLKVVLDDEPLLIKKFAINGYSATINQTNKIISLVLPAGTGLSNLTPILTLSGSATHYTPEGEQDFTPDTVVYTVFDENNNIPYKVAVEANAVSDSVNTIAVLTIETRTSIIDNVNNTITCEFPSFSAPLGNWSVDFTLDSELSTANFTRGHSHDFSTGPLLLTVRAQNGNERVYTVTASISEKQKTIAFLTSNGRLATYDTLLFSAFEDYFVDVVMAYNALPTGFYDSLEGYDLIVLHSNISNTNLTVNSIRALIGQIPVLNLNAQFYAAASWNWGVPANGGPYSNENYDVYVSSSLQNHPIFQNVNFHTDEHATIRSALKYYTDGRSVTSNNAIQCIAELNGANFSGLKASSHALAAIEGMYGEADQIHEINTANDAKYLFIGLSYQGDSYNYLSNNSILLLKNAADYLTNSGIYYDYSNKVTVTLE